MKNNNQKKKPQQQIKCRQNSIYILFQLDAEIKRAFVATTIKKKKKREDEKCESGHEKSGGRGLKKYTKHNKSNWGFALSRSCSFCGFR
jgi:hypothetical protein